MNGGFDNGVAEKSIKEYHECLTITNPHGLWKYLVTYFNIDPVLKTEVFKLMLSGNANKLYDYLHKNCLCLSAANRAKGANISYENKIGGLKRVVDVLGAQPKRLLDIGTESAEYLNDAAKMFGDARGLNIETGFNHYDSGWKNSKIILYDGINIPDIEKFNIDGKFDIVTMYSVMHHIPPKNILPLLKNLHKICNPGTILFLKENDLIDKGTQDAFVFQHMLWWLAHSYNTAGIPVSYMNKYITRDFIVEECAAAGWSLRYEYAIPNAFRVVYLAFVKDPLYK